MRRATFLRSVQANLLDIHVYIAEANGSVRLAERFVRDLRDQCHGLAAFTSMVGRARPELRPDIRSFPFRGYMIFFRYQDERFEVVNILEGHRDIDSFFAKS